MTSKLTLLHCTLVSALLIGCGGDDSPFSEGGGSTSSLPVSDKNFNMVFSPVEPEVITDDGFSSGIEMVVTANAGDRNNVSVSGGTVYFKTDWGILDSNSCEITNGSCSITWTSDADPAFLHPDLFVTFTAYTLGEESYIDTNGNGEFDDPDTITFVVDQAEPFVDYDHDGVYTPGFIDEIIDLDANGQHTPGDTLYNGETCTHSTLCSTTQLINIVDISYINLDRRALVAAPVFTITIDTPTSGDIVSFGTNVNFTATATDPEDGNVTNVVWESDLDGIIGTTGVDFTINNLQEGTHTITATATDSDANVATDTITLTVTALPVATITLPADGTTVTVGATVNFVVDATDSEDGTITGIDAPLVGNNIVWNSSSEGDFGTNSNNITVNTTGWAAAPTAHTITVTVTDSNGNTATDTITLNVNP